MSTHTFTRTTATEWVCVDCHLAVAGYSDEETGRPTPEPFAGVDGIEDVTNGTSPAACDTPECRAAAAADDYDRLELHTEHDHDSFSLHPCAGCGGRLAGDRYAVTVSYLEWSGDE